MDGKGKVGFGKFCHQKSGVCERMAREKKDSENFAIRKRNLRIGWQKTRRAEKDVAIRK